MLHSLKLIDLTSEFYSMVRGALLFLTIYHLTIYFIYHSKIYVYYALYSMFLYFFLISHIYVEIIPPFFYYSERSFQLIAVACYFMFAREILQTKKIDPAWDKILKSTTITILIFSAIVFITVVFINKDVQNLIFLGVIFGAITITIINFFIINTKKHEYINLFIVGTLILLIFLLITLLIYVFKLDYYLLKIGLHRMFFLYTGIIIEFLVFAFLISIRYRTILDEKAQLDLAISKAKIEINEFKMMTLKSQLNPLFLFNTLNSINNLVLKNNAEEASDFLTKFARFIRNILNNSNKTTISLYDEIVNLRLYIKLEKIRSSYSFDYIEVIQEEINLHGTKVPPLFLQPFIENAIWHGLSHKNGDRNVTLYIKMINKEISFDIIDNGIGINKAKELNKLKLTKSVSGATDSAIYRINRVFNSQNVSVLYEDLSHESEMGTKVHISFPLIN